MSLLIQAIIFCIIFTVMILPAQYRDPLSMIMSYPPGIIKRVEQLPQYKDVIVKRERSHITKKIVALILLVIVFAVISYFSGCRDFVTAFIHVFVLFFAVNVYDLVVLDWGIFCHSKKLKIAGTEDMEQEYKNHLFHLRGAAIGLILGLIVAGVSAGLVQVFVRL